MFPATASPCRQPARPRPASRPVGHAGGFTVVEVFAVIALLAAAVALAIVNMDFSTAKWSVRPARESVIYAVGEAHNQSRLRKEDMFLRYDAEEEVLLIENTDGEDILRITLPKGQVTTMTFYRILPETERTDSLTREAEEESVSSITFSPSGSSTPTLIELDTPDGRSSMIFDPFSLHLIQDARD